MTDGEVGELWWMTKQRDISGVEVRALIRKLVNERTIYHLRGVDNIIEESKQTAQLRALDDFGIDLAKWKE